MGLAKDEFFCINCSRSAWMLNRWLDFWKVPCFKILHAPFSGPFVAGKDMDVISTNDGGKILHGCMQPRGCQSAAPSNINVKSGQTSR